MLSTIEQKALVPPCLPSLPCPQLKQLPDLVEGGGNGGRGSWGRRVSTRRDVNTGNHLGLLYLWSPCVAGECQ